MKVVHVINALSANGAETMLLKLLTMLDRGGWQAEVVALAWAGPLGPRIAALGVSVRILGIHPGLPNPWGVARLARWLAARPPDLVQTWMYHADLVGGVAARLAGIPAAWNIRHGDFHRRHTRAGTRLTVKACARLSRRLAARIVCCSETSRRVHAQLGYAAERMVVIPNGFDLGVFRPDPEARRALRAALGVPADALLIGQVARFHPQKDHVTFLAAARRLGRPDVHFVLCGDGVTPDNGRLARAIGEAGMAARVHLLGRRDDVERVTAALDIASLSSAWGEGFPNVVGEAMSAGVPCAVTDVGDAALIVGDTGRVVPRRAPEALAAAWRDLLDLGPEGRRGLGAAARARVARHFGLASVAGRYASLYREILARAAGAPGARAWA